MPKGAAASEVIRVRFSSSMVSPAVVRLSVLPEAVLTESAVRATAPVVVKHASRPRQDLRMGCVAIRFTASTRERRAVPTDAARDLVSTTVQSAVTQIATKRKVRAAIVIRCAAS